MDKKLFKKTYPFKCSNCGEFMHSKMDYCEICGEKGTVIPATKEDFKHREE